MSGRLDAAAAARSTLPREIRFLFLEIDGHLQHADPRDAFRPLDRLDVNGDRLEALGDLRRHALLTTSPEVLRQELLGRREHRHVVHGPHEAVPFVGRDRVLHREPAVPERHDDLVGLGLVDARVIRALDDEERRRGSCRPS